MVGGIDTYKAVLYPDIIWVVCILVFCLLHFVGYILNAKGWALFFLRNCVFVICHLILFICEICCCLHVHRGLQVDVIVIDWINWFIGSFIDSFLHI